MEKEKTFFSADAYPVSEAVRGAEALIMTHEEYRNHPFARSESERSYVFTLTDASKTLRFFGGEHSNDPHDPLFEEIETSFAEFHPDKVYVEGIEALNEHASPGTLQEWRKELGSLSKEDAKRHGEPFLVLKLAAEAGGVDFESPEPSDSEEISALVAAGFSRGDIFLFYMYRQIDQYLRENPLPVEEECMQYLTRHVEAYRRASGWEDAEVEVLKNGLFAALDLASGEYYSKQVDPVPWEGVPQTVINEISRYSSTYRDRHIVARIAQGLTSHSRLFVVYGSAHAVRLEPALKNLFEHLSRQENESYGI